MRNPNALTLRPIEPENSMNGDVMVSELKDEWRRVGIYREVNPIPEGYEVCDLADATKVLIGETFVGKLGRIIRIGDGSWFEADFLSGLGVLAIRPIPEPEPMRGEAEVAGGLNRGKCAGIAAFPAILIGKVIRWEVVKDGGE